MSARLHQAQSRTRCPRCHFLCDRHDVTCARCGQGITVQSGAWQVPSAPPWIAEATARERRAACTSRRRRRGFVRDVGIATATFAMLSLFDAGAPWTHYGLMALAGSVALGAVVGVAVSVLGDGPLLATALFGSGMMFDVLWRASVVGIWAIDHGSAFAFGVSMGFRLIAAASIGWLLGTNRAMRRADGMA